MQYYSIFTLFNQIKYSQKKSYFMRKKITILLFFIFTMYNFSFSENYEPLELAKLIFSKNSIKDIDKYISGEYTGRPNGTDIAENVTLRFLLLGQFEKKAVVSITAIDSLGLGLDFYLHFEKDNIWKICAFRTLALPGFFGQLITELENMTMEQVDSIILASKNKTNQELESNFTSRDDYYFYLNNAKLTVDLDDNIIKHFLKNKAEFERIKDKALLQLKNNKEDYIDRKFFLNLKPEYRPLLIDAIVFGDVDLCDCLTFLIGGILDNSVGFIYVKDKNDLPEMDPSSVIMIKEIGDGWYLYKTT